MDIESFICYISCFFLSQLLNPYPIIAASSHSQDAVIIMKSISCFTSTYMICITLFQGQEFAEQYKLEYQREEGGRWVHYTDKWGNQVSL